MRILFMGTPDFAVASLNALVEAAIKLLPQNVSEDGESEAPAVKPLNIAVVGRPNVGKSTFINSYAKKSCTKVGNKPGVTKGKQWIRIGKDVELLDTPGILWPKFDDQEVGLRLAYIGSINDEILTKSELALKFIDFLKINYCNALTDRYNIDIDIQNSENFEILKQIAVARLCLLKGNEPDLDKAAAILFDDFRSGRLGRMTLEEIPE